MERHDDLGSWSLLERIVATFADRDDVGIVVTDADGLIRWGKAPHARAVLQLPESHYLGHPAANGLHPDDRDEHRRTHRRVLQSGGTARYVARIRDGSGAWVREQIVKWAARTPAGQLVVVAISIPLDHDPIPSERLRGLATRDTGDA